MTPAVVTLSGGVVAVGVGEGVGVGVGAGAGATATGWAKETCGAGLEPSAPHPDTVTEAAMTATRERRIGTSTHRDSAQPNLSERS